MQSKREPHSAGLMSHSMWRLTVRHSVAHRSFTSHFGHFLVNSQPRDHMPICSDRNSRERFKSIFLHNNPIVCVFFFTMGKFADIFQFKMIVFVAEEVSAFSMEIPSKRRRSQQFLRRWGTSARKEKKAKQNRNSNSWDCQRSQNFKWAFSQTERNHQDIRTQCWK